MRAENREPEFCVYMSRYKPQPNIFFALRQKEMNELSRLKLQCIPDSHS